MSWYHKSSGRKVFLLRHLGAGGAVYFCPGIALILTSGIEKEAWILWVSFHGSFTPGMALSSTHQVGVLSWQSCQSSQVSTSEMGGSSRQFSAHPPGSGSTSGSLKVTLLPNWGLVGDLGCLLQEPLWLWALLQLLLWLLVWLQVWLLLQLPEQVHGVSLIPWLNLSISPRSMSMVSNALWWATLRTSSYDSLLQVAIPP